MPKSTEGPAQPESPAQPAVPAQPAPPQTPVSFEAALAELEAIVARMEEGQMPLEESLAAYKRGTELLQYCQARLKDAQQQVRVLEAGTLQDFPTDDSR
ncbi:exodeoxyribonuclease VII small subunit [Pelomicrobium methylotrophicum]|uniref:Exodeoxyribonuclease 7 small subunit n=1 Tax=Pelomicrobium methylotrophicum TaxID=2602750 RepID=A0A5C7EIV5_9PROT|nr:exodeoxyribonuclease VII small subunit [Pelomicrobium methylotrophicum]TXF12027.1 exodeoxyribonuclease VII small subunit [Pelomicrobium methylotrophicum]